MSRAAGHPGAAGRRDPPRSCSGGRSVRSIRAGDRPTPRLPEASSRCTRRGFWGSLFASYPEALLAELNGPKRPDRITELSGGSYARKG